jgi:undecaprenyl-diphosphatase
MSFSNHAVFLAIHNLSGRNGFADAIGIFLAEWMPYLLAIAFLALVFMQPGARKKFYLFAEGALAVILARGIVTPLIQLFYHEPRPFSFYGFAPLIGESGWSFPSAHAALFFALLIPVWYANKKWGWWYLAAAALMAVARVYAGVHWPLDIVAGAIIGIASGFFVRWLLRDARRGIELPATHHPHHPEAAATAVHLEGSKTTVQ